METRYRSYRRARTPRRLRNHLQTVRWKKMRHPDGRYPHLSAYSSSWAFLHASICAVTPANPCSAAGSQSAPGTIDREIHRDDREAMVLENQSRSMTVLEFCFHGLWQFTRKISFETGARFFRSTLLGEMALESPGAWARRSRGKRAAANIAAREIRLKNFVSDGRHSCSDFHRLIFPCCAGYSFGLG